jgi:hypothetical protein
VRLNGTNVATFTSTGLNSTAIGATTASTGAFTTLSASSTLDVGSTSTLRFTQLTNNDQSNCRLRFINTGSGGQTWDILGGTNGASNAGLGFLNGSTTYMQLSTTGLAVTGALSSTNSIGARSGGALQLWDSANTDYSYIQNNGSSAATQTIIYTSFGSGSVAHQFRTYSGAVINALNITPAGNVGIGTTTPSVGLVYENNTPTKTDDKMILQGGYLSGAGGQDYGFYTAYRLLHSNGSSLWTAARIKAVESPAWGGQLIFETNPAPNVVSHTTTERMRILANGNIGIGTASPVEKVYVSDGLNEFGINPTTLASPFNAVNGTSLDFRFTANGNTNARFAAIVGALDVGSAGNNSGHLEFWTAPTGSGNPAIAERMRIDSSGNVLMGNTVVNPASGFSDQRGFGYANSTGQVQIATTANAAAMEIGKNNANDGNIIVFRKQATTVGNISITGSATTYNSGSDYRLKDITGPLTDSATFIDNLKPKVGTWKADGSKFVGFLAHEFAEVSPSSVSGEKDAVDSDGKPVYQAMQASSSEVIANLVAELQSLRARLAALESK